MKFCRSVVAKRSSQIVVLTALLLVTIALYSHIYQRPKRVITLSDMCSHCLNAEYSEGQKNVSNIFNYFDFDVSRVDDSKKCIDADNCLSNLKSNVYLSDKTIFNVGRKVEHANCFELFKGNELEINETKEIDINRTSVGLDKYIEMSANCTSFIRNRNYITEPLTQEENEFPIAFSILVYTEIEQFERLLRAIYRPQNSYCVHVELKSEDMFKAVSAIAKCFPNIYLAPRRMHVTWGKMSVLDPELVCMKELWARNKLWKYFINLTGQEFPLKTNYELVKILTALNGANDVNGSRTWANPGRWSGGGTPPHGISPTKGAVHITVSRGFVEYVLFDTKALDLLKWVEKTVIPDETFFTSLNHNPHLKVPGSYTRDPDKYPKPFLSRFKKWYLVGDYVCRGKFVRYICIFSVGDLPMLANRTQLFANKFFYNYHRTAYDCMEELHYNRTRDQALGNLKFDASWYGALDFVQNTI